MPSQPSTFHLHCQQYFLDLVFAYQQHYIAELLILNWHFALVIRAPGAPRGQGIEHTIDTDNKCFFFDTTRSNIQVTEKQAIIVAPLLAANGEDTDNDLYSAVENIAKQVPTATTSQIASGDFNNCFDFATEVARRLGTAKYLAAANVEEFVNYHNEFAAKVKEKTNAGTQRLCARGNSTCGDARPSSTKGGKSGNTTSASTITKPPSL
ncbi:hypothetical protein F5879DRAFT_924517 [Lentinula edodes]|nr:hypothetical protein F5879DRAFT_924517 [Lentinula edodes]